MIAISRLAILLCHFVYGPRFWRRVKRVRCFKILNYLEYENRVEFEIYDAKEYVDKVNDSLM